MSVIQPITAPAARFAFQAPNPEALMRNIPFQRFAGSVSAFGSYGLPSLTGIRVDRRLALFLTIIGALVLLRAIGVLDDHGFGLLAGAGPISLLQGHQAEANELEDERDTIIA